jgi:hypothetical protein
MGILTDYRYEATEVLVERLPDTQDGRRRLRLSVPGADGPGAAGCLHTIVVEGRRGAPLSVRTITTTNPEDL